MSQSSNQQHNAQHNQRDREEGGKVSQRPMGREELEREQDRKRQMRGGSKSEE